MKGIKDRPDIIFLIYLLIALGLHFVLPIVQLIDWPFRLLGVPLVLIGIWLSVKADSLFKINKTAIKPFDKPSVLVIEGPFKISRNPMYLGMALALLGEALILGSLITFPAPAIYFIHISLSFIPGEERNMEEVFAQEYLDYKKRVRRWI
jgi:protein-S-isoprenylcysteine O-methyltransferase Ste14